MGLDLGERRIGVAVSAGAIAVPHGTIERSGDLDRDRATIAGLVAELEVDHVVVGLPLSLNGNVGPAARRAEAEAEALRQILAVPVELFDERLTTVTASRSLTTAGVRGRARRSVVDQVAATVLVQAWMDRLRARTEEA